MNEWKNGRMDGKKGCIYRYKSKWLTGAKMVDWAQNKLGSMIFGENG